MDKFINAIDVVAPELVGEFPTNDYCAKAGCHGALHRLVEEGRLAEKHAQHLVTILNGSLDPFQAAYEAAGGPKNEPVALASFDAQAECWPECWGNTSTQSRLEHAAEQIGIAIRGDKVAATTRRAGDTGRQAIPRAGQSRDMAQSRNK